MVLEVDFAGLLVLIGVFMGSGGFAIVAVQWVRGNNTGGIGEVYQKGKGNQIQVARVRLSWNDDVFTVGERQFAVAPEFIARYTKWNRWGGRVPTYRYEIQAARPGAEVTATQEKIQSLGEKAFIDPKPSSASVNLIFRRGGLKAMISSTKKVAMDPRLVGIMCLLGGLALGFLIFNFYHPNLVPTAPPGYHFVVQPDPTNSTQGSAGIGK